MSVTQNLSPDSTDAAAPVSTGIRLWRRTLIAVGVLILAWGTFVMFDDVKLTRIPGVALWIGAAIILHDGILAPIVFFVGLLLRRGGAKRLGTAILVVQGAIVVGSIMSLIVVPAIIAQNFAPDNPTILPFNYALNLGVFWLVVAVLATGLSFALYARSRRAKDRLSTTQS